MLVIISVSSVFLAGCFSDDDKSDPNDNTVVYLTLENFQQFLIVTGSNHFTISSAHNSLFFDNVVITYTYRRDSITHQRTIFLNIGGSGSSNHFTSGTTHVQITGVTGRVIIPNVSMVF